MMIIIPIVSGVVSLVTLVCWVMTLVAMAKDSEKGGVGHAIGGFFCGLYALVWGWQNRERLERQTVMKVWLAATFGGIVLNVLAGAMMA
jgi:hypothetical protein